MRRLLPLAFLLALFLTSHAQAQVYQGKTLVKASLVANRTAIVPGQPFEVGLLLETAEHWHTYGEYPGDAGIPTSIEWTLPAGFASGPFQWPLPAQEIEPGDIEVYAYEGTTMLLTTIVAPKDLAEKSVTLQAKASWLVCAEICVPGSAELELTLPVASTNQPANEKLFAEYHAQLPESTPPPFSIQWAQDGKDLVASITGINNAQSLTFFPLPAPEQEVGHPKGGEVKDGSARITIDAKAPLSGIMVATTGNERKGWLVSSAESAAPTISPARATPAFPLWKALLYGFLGGLILNLMPCVLPVISLKIFGFIKQAGDERSKILKHGLAFVAGIFVWFLALAAVIIALKSAGHQVTWAFQFQNVWFNVVIATIVFVFALNLFGVFEILLPGQAGTALENAGDASGYAGSFFQGLFATLLATPCTAPFLGPALGFAFAQNSEVILATFLCVALGMSAPYFLLSAQPGWMKFLPKPGAWMERVRQFMGFPLLATMLWLLFIIGSQRGLEASIWVACFFLIVAIACWIYGSFCGLSASRNSKFFSTVVIVLLLAGGGHYFLWKKFSHTTAPSAAASSTEGIPWVPFTQSALDGALKSGKPVFVDFTADWCLTCKFNERTAISTPAVRAAFEKNGILPMKADWTNANPEITAALAKFSRVGVPFYVLYPAGQPDSPIVLPELLTEQIVLDALAKAR